MNRIGNRIDLANFTAPQLSEELHEVKKETASPASRSWEYLAEVQQRPHGLRLVSGEGAKVTPSSSPADQATQKIQEDFKNRFAELAGNPEKFHGLMKEVYGANYDKAAAESIRQKASSGDFSWLPKIEFKSEETLQGGNGAFDASRNVVYLNDKFMNDPQKAAEIYSEEVGHFLDTKLNKTDTLGDEGEMFRRLLHGEKLTNAQKAEIRADNDHGVINVNGKQTEVEFWNPFKAVKNAVKAVGNAVSGAAKAVGNAVSGAAKAVGHAVSRAASSVGNWVSGAAKKAGGAVVDGFKWVGNKVADVAHKTWDGIKWLGDKTWGGMKWIGEGVAKAAKWIGPRLWDGVRGLGTGLWDTIKGVGHNLFEGVSTIGGAFGKLVKGDFGGFFKDLGSGLLKTFVQTPVDATLLMGGKAISAIQTLVGLEPVGRKLTDDEITELKKVYGDTIDYSKVRIKEGDAGLFSLTGRAFTHGDTIYVPKDDLPLTKDLLVHEMGHVWQHQNGGTDYMSEALVGQYLGDGYKFEKGIQEGKSWSELNPEQQAELLQQAYLSGFFNSPGRRFVYNGTDYTDYLNEALRQVRAGQGAP